MILLFGTLFALLALGAPVFVAIGGAAATYLLVNGINPLIAVQQMVAGVDSFPLLAVPFFILAGALMNAGAITERLYGFAHALVGHWKGGLGHVNIYGSFIFSMMSGTAIADAGGLGQIEIKAMLSRGYPRGFAVGLSAASATLGPLIPPSLAMVVYGYAANVSVGQLFVAGILPGVLMAITLHVLVAVAARRNGFPVEAKESWSERGWALLRSLPALMTPVIILGGIIAGVMTPTEAAAVASLYALGLATVAYRSLDLAGIVLVWRETFETTAVVLLMVSASVLFGWILVRENAASQFAALLLALVSEPWQALIVLNVILLIAGMFLDTIAIILIAVPIFVPVIRQFGIDPVHFGIVMILNLMIGLMTPPIGLLLFVMSRIGGLGYLETFRACLPFVLALAGVLLTVTFVPGIALALPSLFFR